MSRAEWQNPQPMEEEPRRLRADAERNRRRLLEAATEMFCERGLDVGVGEIAHQAGVGRGTLFRNFPSKEHLIAAILVARVHESVARGRAALESPDPGGALFELIDQSVGLSQTDRALFDALDDAWLANEEIRGAHREMMRMLDALVRRAQDAGAVRGDIGAVDVMLMVKGVCEAARSFQHVGPDVPLRQIDLIKAAISAEAEGTPLRGQPPTIEALEHNVVPVAGTIRQTSPKTASA